MEDVKALMGELEYDDVWPFQRRRARAPRSNLQQQPLWLASICQTSCPL